MKPRPNNVLGRLAAKRDARQARKFIGALIPHLSLVDLKSQCGQESDWNALQTRLIEGMQMARDHFYDDVVGALYRALVTLSQIHAQESGRANRWYATACEASVLGLALCLTDDMESMCTDSEILRSQQAAWQPR